MSLSLIEASIHSETEKGSRDLYQYLMTWFKDYLQARGKNPEPGITTRKAEKTLVKEQQRESVDALSARAALTSMVRALPPRAVSAEEKLRVQQRRQLDVLPHSVGEINELEAA